ncbi:Phosphatidylinositol 4-kinase gamma 7 [Striga hermonthica]|uniref:1-phosphatidylinositol 4-kinase n=1 Tax=Striga hermonthica TaxID=68872 RepID=A0A9N7N8G1_STRHE|nr:Phosphatidylinositol 4-kinase gamma 7 [Striga hermonthica]
MSAFKGPLAGGDCRMEGKPSCWRRVFVQTDNGSVLGMELDRSDNVRTVKKRLQLALNIPIEESSLTFGDTVLKSDLSAVQNDSPLLLTRNLMHRSSSTPCLSPTGRDGHKSDPSGPIEILGRSAQTKHLVKEVVKGMKNGVDPVPVRGGLGGAYYFKNIWGESVVIVKPTDEEPFAPNNPKGFVGRALGRPGLKRSVRVGETGFREVAAYLLDHAGFAGVPPTALVKITHSVFNVNGSTGVAQPQPEPVSKIASFQAYVRHDFDAGDYGTSSFPVAAVHRIGILDVRIHNTDRHAGNLLVRKVDDAGGFGEVELIPIDHGLCLPESLEDPYFEWVHWPQASIPFSDDELEYIRNLDPVRDLEMLRSELPMIREACLRILFLCTAFLKEAAAYGLCLAEIGEMMSREFRGGEEGPSELEIICMEARRLVGLEIFSPRVEVYLGGTQFDLDCEDGKCGDYIFSPRLTSQEFVAVPPFHSRFGSVNCCAPLSKLDECVGHEDDEESEGDDGKGLVSISNFRNGTRNILKQSMSLENPSLGIKYSNFSNISLAKQDSCSVVNGPVSCKHRSANEQLPASTSFVKLADMNEDEWQLFLDKFQELILSAFAKGKSVMSGQKQRQRLGTSCRF